VDAQLVRWGYAVLFACLALLHLYNALHYATLIRASFAVTGILFFLFACALSIIPLTAPVVVIANAGIIATMIGALIIVQTIIALNGRIAPFRRRKGE
jgi:hypothetical protein